MEDGECVAVPVASPSNAASATAASLSDQTKRRACNVANSLDGAAKKAVKELNDLYADCVQDGPFLNADILADMASLDADGNPLVVALPRERPFHSGCLIIAAVAERMAAVKVWLLNTASLPTCCGQLQ